MCVRPYFPSFPYFPFSQMTPIPYGRALSVGALLLLSSCTFVLEGPTVLVARPDGDFGPVMILDSPAAREALAHEAGRQRLDGNHITEKNVANWRAFLRTQN